MVAVPRHIGRQSRPKPQCLQGFYKQLGIFTTGACFEGVAPTNKIFKTNKGVKAEPRLAPTEKKKRGLDMNDKNTVKQKGKYKFNFRIKDETINGFLSTKEAIKWQN